MPLFAGLDWGGARHAVCVVDEAGKVVADFEVAHDAEGLAALLKRLGKLSPAAQLAVAIERPSGLVVDTLVAAGHPVVPVHPNVVKACQPRYRAATGKHDLGDAYLLADVLRTDGHRFRPLTPQSDAIKALCALVRTRDDLVAERVALANQLRSLLESFWPCALAIFSDSPIARAFVRRYPTPQSAAHLGEERLASFLAQEQDSGRRPVAELAKLSSRIEHDVATLADGQLVMSLPRTGRINAAQILAELGDVRERFQTEEQLAAEAGVCPVTYESGKSRGVGFRWACNHRLRRALTTWADNSRHASPRAADIYARARARGCDHPHAIRILARAWVRVLWRTWTSRTAYNPALHGGARKFLAAA